MDGLFDMLAFHQENTRMSNVWIFLLRDLFFTSLVNRA